ncbi:MAG: hypothetical protein K0R38_3383 [Polyangiaceae bacterium]|nr:hypothetical protein [Polyangiaceae bacterium]
MKWLAVPLVLQALAMLVDELYFHRRRGLPRWERIGHPVDTASVLGCYGLALAVPASAASLPWYGLLATISCLLVTKDEIVHAARCEPAEQWLHAVLFVLHPIVLGVGAWLWLRGEQQLLMLSAVLTAAFGVYQAVYWNFSWKKPSKFPSTTPSTTSSASAGTEQMMTPSRSCAPNPGSETRG